MKLAFARRRISTASWPAHHYWRVARHLSAVQTAVAAAKATFAMAVLSVSHVVVPVVAALMAFAVYTANDLTDGDEDAVNQPAKARFVARWRAEIAVASTLAGVTAIALATLHGGPLAGAVVLAPAVCGVVYSVPLLPFERPRRVKDVLVANTALVAAAWAVPLAALPAILGDGVPLGPTIAVGGYLFVRTFVSVEVFNARDVAGDRASGVATLPVVVGLARTRHVLLALDLASLAVIAWAVATLSLPLAPALVAVPVTVYSINLTRSLGETTDWTALCLAKDGEYVLLGGLGLLAL